jgi:hypothetical protein
MLRILLDENIPAALRRLIIGHQVTLAYDMGWAGVSNGDLITAAEAKGFEVLITADQNIRYQQNLTGRQLALIVLSTNIWPTIRANPAPILAAIRKIQPGDYMPVALDRPPRRGRNPPTTLDQSSS